MLHKKGEYKRCKRGIKSLREYFIEIIGVNQKKKLIV